MGENREDDTKRSTKCMSTVFHISAILSQMARISRSISDLYDEARIKTSNAGTCLVDPYVH